jgi:hypothetical protein
VSVVTASEHPPAATIRNPTEFLHVDVEQLARTFAFVTDRGSCDSIQTSEPRQAVTNQDRVHGRRCQTQTAAQQMGSLASISTQRDHPGLNLRRRTPRTRPGTTRTILQTAQTLSAPPP